MTAFLYSLTIHPLELAYKYLYIALSGLAGDYGAALLGLSVVSTVIFGPLKALAASMQARETLIQQVMAPQLAAIKAQSRGAERQARTAALYRRYAYHPLMTLRSSFGILLQVPFLCAAYYMLGSFEPIQGHPCWIIPDLGKADGLLYGVNALPLLMTVFNIGAVYTTDGFSRRDRLQALAVAALFLALLYGAPSALLIYWTGNNALMLLGNCKKYLPLREAASFTVSGAAFGAALKARAGTGMRLAVKEEGALFCCAAAIVSLTLTVFAPAMLYRSSPQDFSLPFSSILFDLLPGCMVVLLFFAVLRLLMPRPLRPWLTFAVLFATMAGLVNATVFTGSYGALDGARLTGSAELGSTAGLARDALVLSGAAALLTAVFYFRQTKKLLLAMQVTVFLLAGAGASTLLADRGKTIPPAAYSLETAAGDPFFAFSKDKTNVAVFFLDMFTGGHVGEIFAENPDMAGRFPGFVWYPDTASEGNITSASSPSIFGGPGFIPEMMDARPERTLHQKFNEALAVLPRHFGAKGFDASLLHPIYPLDREVFAAHAGNAPRILDKPALDGLVAPWARAIGADVDTLDTPNYSEFLFAISLFKALPHAFKIHVYNNGEWLSGWTDGVPVPPALRKTLYDSAVLGMLPALANTASEKPTLKIIYSELPHHAWHLQRDSLVPVTDPYPGTKGQEVLVDGVLPEHLYTERHTLALLAAFFDWLRAEGVYDNTMIILVSDHCDGDSRTLNEAFGMNVRGERPGIGGKTRYPGRPHALLMVKALGDTRPFRTDTALMSSSDMPALACQAIGGCEELPMPDTGPGRVRRHFIATEWRQIEVPGKTTYDPAPTAIIRGTMFRPENWSLSQF